MAVLLAYGAAEFIAWQMSRVAPLPERIQWALATVRAGGNPSRYEGHPYACYVPRPGYVNWTGVRQHNSLGFRGPEIAIPKPPGTFRIVCLGGSTTYSTAVERIEDTFVAQLEAFLRAETGHQGIEVVNAGAPGGTSADALQTVAFRLGPVEPDLLLLHTGINDSAALTLQGHQLDYTHGRPPFVTPRYSRLTRTLLFSPIYRLVFSRTRLPTMLFWGLAVETGSDRRPLPEPAAYRANLESLFLLAQSRGVPVIVVNETILAGSHAEEAHGKSLAIIRQAGEEVARRYGIPVSHFERFECPREEWSDGYHLRAGGLRLKAQFIGRDLLAYGIGCRVPGAANPESGSFSPAAGTRNPKPAL